MDQLILAYGPFAVFLLLMLSGIGLPLSEDLIIIPAGVLVGAGSLNPWLTLISAYAGVLVADCMWFGLCYRYGTPLLHQRWFKRTVHPRRLLEVKHEIERRGAWVIVMARFIPGSRTPAITMAGLLHMSFLRFLAAEAACVAVTVPIQIGLGYLVSRGVGTESTAHRVITMVGVVVAVLALMIGLRWWRAHRRRHRRPKRAPVAWLRRFRRPKLPIRGLSRSKRASDQVRS